jgi:hypothetical protein
MLVATAITLIILLIFAQVFRSATHTIGVQRGIGQNDARARMFNTIIRNDLQKATFRDHAASTSRGLLTLDLHDINELGFTPVHRDQAGYWYVSENDVDNDIDDVLQFTISVDETQRNKENHPYVGKASPIARPPDATVQPGEYNPRATAGNPDRNQTEFDDGNNGNLASQSRFAEVCYFVRNGTLYRRVMLLRDPIATGPSAIDMSQPEYIDDMLGTRPLLEQVGSTPDVYDYTTDVDYTQSNASEPEDGDTPGVGDFWNDFDYSAIHQDPADPAASSASLLYLSKLDLSNTTPRATRLSNPSNRFGHQYRSDYTAATRLTGNPVEYVNNGTTFIGRVTHEETSHPAFGWPGRFNPASNPLVQTNLTLSNGVVAVPGAPPTVFDGPRRGEDILLTNVDAFDIKLFEIDTGRTLGLGSFVDIGHAGTGVLSASARANTDYGPRTIVENNIFDTWHPDNLNYGRAPFRPLYQNPLNAAGGYAYVAPPAATPIAGIPNPPTPTTNRTIWDWEPDVDYDIRDSASGGPGSRIYPFLLTQPDVGADGKPGNANADDDSDGEFDEADELGYAGSDDDTPGIQKQYDGLYYEAIAEATGSLTGTSGTTRPVFLKRYGHRLVDNGILWQCFDNRVGVTLIQITIRYRDPDSNLSRQVTIQHSLTDRSE